MTEGWSCSVTTCVTVWIELLKVIVEGCDCCTIVTVEGCNDLVAVVVENIVEAGAGWVIVTVCGFATHCASKQSRPPLLSPPLARAFQPCSPSVFLDKLHCLFLVA